MRHPNPVDTAHATYLLNLNPDPLLAAVTAAAYKQASRKCSHDVAEDIAQRAAIACWIKLHDYQLRSKYSTWVHGVVALEIAHHYTHAAPSIDGKPVTEQLSPAHDQSSPVSHTASVPELTPDERLLLQLRAEGYTYAEIGRSIGESEVNCRQLVRRIRKRLAPCHEQASVPPLISREPKKRADRPQLPVTPISLTMGPDVIEQYSDGSPAIVPIVHGWRPAYRVTYTATLPDNNIVFSA